MKNTLKNPILSASIEVEDNGNEITAITLLKGSVVTENGDKLPTFLKEIIKTKAARNPSTGKLETTENIALPTVTATQLILTGKKGNASKWIATAFTLGETKPTEQVENVAPKQETKPVATAPIIDRQKLVTDIRTFCKDFDYSPDNRVLDTMKYAKDSTALLLAFMKVTGYDSELVNRAENDFKSAEWKELMKTLAKIEAKRSCPINKRLSIYFGAAGTGKTTKAVNDYPNAVKIAGSASFDPDDLFTRFDPSTKQYALTEIGHAMQEGKPLIFDEANLCNAVVLQRLQAVLDNTDKITDRGFTIDIKEGFKVIITMNLETNLGKTPLPNPLVSRAIEIIDFDKNPDFKDKTADFIW